MSAHLSFHNIAVVDDDADCRVLVARLIKNAGGGKTVQQFEDGAAFLSYLESLLASGRPATLPAVLFLDINLPRQSGVEVLEWIGSRVELKGMLKAVLTNSDHPADIAKARAAGAHCYLMKFPAPDTIKALLSAFDALESKRSRNDNEGDLTAFTAKLPFPVPAPRSRALRSDLHRSA